MKTSTRENQGGNYSRGREYRWKDVLDFIFLRKNIHRKKLKILDVGCGDGYLNKFINQYNHETGSRFFIEYFGLDIWPGYKKIVEANGGSFVCASYSDLGKLFPKKYFDIIIASEIIEHIDETDHFISTLRSSLSNDGYLYITTPNLASYHSRILLLFGYLPLQMEVSNINSSFGHGPLQKYYYGDNPTPLHHIRCFTLRAMNDFLSFHHIRAVQIRGGGYSTPQNILFRFFPDLAPVLKLICKRE